jgi:hypothetical protein
MSKSNLDFNSSTIEAEAEQEKKINRVKLKKLF